MKQNLAAKRSTLPPQSLIVWRSQSFGLFWCGPLTWCHAKATLMSRMYLTANVDHFFFFFMFISSHSGFHLSDAVHSRRQKVISSVSLGLFHDMPVQVWVIPEVETDAGGETRCNAYPSQRLNKNNVRDMHWDIRFFQCHCVHMDSKENVSVHVCQAEVTVCDHLQAVCMHRHSHMCGQPVCFSVTLLCAHMHSSSLYRLQRFIGGSQWRCTLCLCVTTLVELMVSLNVFYAFFHWSVPEKKRRVLFALFIYIYIKKE